VFDFSEIKPKDARVTAFLVTGSWLHLRGFETIGVQVMIKDHTQSINFENEGSDNIYENLAMHDGQGIGFYLTLGERNLVLNCDAYQNYDYTSENGRGGNSDGFGCHSRKPGEPNIFQGCRAWFNSDDGYDCINSASPVIFRDCWAFYNGYTPDFKRRADGNGFKAGGYGTTPESRLPDPIPQHRVEGCLAVRNASSGFYANHHLVGGIWLNNTAYRNSSDFNMLMRKPGNGDDMPGVGHVLKNNLSYQGKRDLVDIDRTKCELAKNSFDLNLSFKDSDFLGLDEKELVAPRKPDGGLPEIKFLHPVQKKEIVDQGVDVGRPYQGKAPDIGAFEFVPKTGISGL
jgi:Right handed beta helix region